MRMAAGYWAGSLRYIHGSSFGTLHWQWRSRSCHKDGRQHSRHQARFYFVTGCLRSPLDADFGNAFYCPLLFFFSDHGCPVGSRTNQDETGCKTRMPQETLRARGVRDGCGGSFGGFDFLFWADGFGCQVNTPFFISSCCSAANRQAGSCVDMLYGAAHCLEEFFMGKDWVVHKYSLHKYT
jgi:hypothetical protein